MRVLLTIIIAIFLFSCASYKAPQKHKFDNVQTYNQSYDIVWSKVIRWFSEHNTPIKTIEKVSGIITTEYNLDAGSYTNYADCGKGGFGQSIKDLTGNFNIMVEKLDDSKTKVTINCFFKSILETKSLSGSPPVNETINCNSIGTLEGEIIDYISQK